MTTNEGVQPAEVREQGCWSVNVAEGYLGALEHCLALLKESVYWLDHSAGIINAANAQKSMTRAQTAMDEAHRWFNQANNQHFRINALVAEIKALRSGQAITYPEGRDPVEDTFRQEGNL